MATKRINSKKKGSRAEQEIAKVFRDIGYSHCMTSRAGSKIHDDAGNDLIHVPYNVQIKAGKQRAMNPTRVLMDMEIARDKFLPPNDPAHEQLDVLIWKRDLPSGRPRRRLPADTLVIMTMDDWLQMAKALPKVKQKIK